MRLVNLLVERGDLDGLRARADTGDGCRRIGWPGCWPSAATWTGPGRCCAQGLTPATGCRRHLAGLLAERGDLDGGECCAPGPTPATGKRPGTSRRPAGPARQTWTELSIDPALRARADAGRGKGRRQGELSKLLAKRGDLDGAESARPGQHRRRGRRLATGRAAGRARRPGRADRAGRPGRHRRRGCRAGAGRAAGRARRPGRGGGSRARADSGDRDAARELAKLLIERGNLDGRKLCAPGPTPATGTPREAARLLTERGDLDGARQGRFGDGQAARLLANLLAERGDLHVLRASADFGDRDATKGLATCWPSAAS